MGRTRVAWRATGSVLAFLLCAVTACGDGATDSGVATAGGARPEAAASASGPDDMTKFAQCMRDNGVDVPDPDPATGRMNLGQLRGTGGERFEQAMSRCRDLLVAARGGTAIGPEELERLRQFAQCMRDNGVDLPDPDPNGSGGMFAGALAKIDRDSPVFKKALEACQDRLPQSILGQRNGS